MKKKIWLLNVRVSTEDAEAIRASAKRAGLTLSEFLRRAATIYADHWA